MQFNIPCEIYSKFARLAMTGNDTDWHVVRIERFKGRQIAIASNRTHAAIYNLGETDQPDGFVNVIANAELIAACEKEIDLKSDLEITPIPALKIASARTTFGFSYAGNAVAFDDKTKLEIWRTFLDPPKKSRGAMFLKFTTIKNLILTSPSGSVAFPEFIDPAKPVVLRDAVDDNWLGILRVTRQLHDGTVSEIEPAKIPAWANGK